jgi:hypothetical protein
VDRQKQADVITNAQGPKESNCYFCFPPSMTCTVVHVYSSWGFPRQIRWGMGKGKGGRVIEENFDALS